MAKLTFDNGSTGQTLYVLIVASSGKFWNGSTFETFSAANWTTYAQLLTELSTSGIYQLTFPTVVADTYSISVRLRSGGTAAMTDSTIGVGEVQWAGTAVGVADPLTSLVPGSYLSGTAGYTLGHLNDNGVTVIAAVNGGVINVYRGTTWTINLVIGNITGYTEIWFTVKKDVNDADSASIVKTSKGSGLLVLNGSSTVTASDGSITVNNVATGDITITLKPSSAMRVAIAPSINYDVKVLNAGVVTMMADGRSKFNVLGDVTRNVA